MSKTQVALIIVLIGLVVMYFTFFKKKAAKTESGYSNTCTKASDCRPNHRCTDNKCVYAFGST